MMPDISIPYIITYITVKIGVLILLLWVLFALTALTAL
jgi:hypothetical protein